MKKALDQCIRESKEWRGSHEDEAQTAMQEPAQKLPIVPERQQALAIYPWKCTHQFKQPLS